MMALGIALTSLSGHIFKEPRMYTWGSAGTMSLPTAVYALLLSGVTFFLGYGMREIEKQTRQAKPVRKKLARS
jgi:hypothetical protein